MDLRNLPKHVVAVAAGLVIFGVTGCGKSSSLRTPDAGQGGEVGSEVILDSAPVDSPVCPPTCDDDDPCTTDSCDTSTFECVHVPLPDGTVCQGRPCTTNSFCQAGVCLDGPYKVCPAPSDSCHLVGLCSPKTGECDNPTAPEGTSCSDGELCTFGDQCKNGVCTGTRLVCSGSVCDPSTGQCPGGFPTALTAWSFNTRGWPANGSGIVKSPDGQSFLGGTYTGQIDLGSGPIVQDPAFGANNSDIFLASLDANTLKAAWIVTFPGPQAQEMTSFAVNGAGHLGVIGSLKGAMFVAGNELDAVYNGDQFILGASAKDGGGLWSMRLNLQSGKTDSRTVGLRAIAGDPNGDSFMICGTVACATSALRPDGGPIPNPAKDLTPSDCQGGTDLVVARINSGQGVDGGTSDRVLWADDVGGTNEEYCGTLAMDSQSSTYVVGTYRFGSKVVFGNQPPLPFVDHAGSAAWMFLAKLDSQDKWAWARGIGTGNQTFTPQAMTTLGADVIVAGTVNGGLSIEGVALDAPAFIARFNGDTGKLVWAKSIGAGTTISINSMAEESGLLLVSGSYSSDCTSCAIGAIPLPPSPGAGGAFIAQIDANSGGVVVGAKGFGVPYHANRAAGVIGLDQAAGGTNLNGSILLLTFSSQIDLGAPVGILSTSAVDGGASGQGNDFSCLAKIAP